MEGARRRERVVVRRHEATRLEEDLWNLAYEQIWPLIRKSLAKQRPSPKPSADDPMRLPFNFAKRA